MSANVKYHHVNSRSGQPWCEASEGVASAKEKNVLPTWIVQKPVDIGGEKCRCSEASDSDMVCADCCWCDSLFTLAACCREQPDDGYVC